ncbi:hypothetical protein ACFE04_012843 [Oxalis oulophora]
MESPNNKTTTSATSISISDLNEDSLTQCFNYLTLQDISNIASTCKSLKLAAYSDSVWLRLFRDRWPQEVRESFSCEGRVRDLYLELRKALYQLKFCDSLIADYIAEPKPFENLLIHKDKIIFSQSSTIGEVKLSGPGCHSHSLQPTTIIPNAHKSRITCMRLFPIVETSLFRNETQSNEDILVTSSNDHSVRLWWKGECQRCFRGHNGPVSTLSDKLLGEDSGKLLASGGEDGTVRLWDFNSSGKRGNQALKATLYGHQKPIKFISSAEHKSSLLVSISTDSKVRVWDTTVSSSSRSSCCVGMTAVPGKPVGIKCIESLLYVAAGSSVETIDLRTMRKVASGAIQQADLCSFAILPSKSLICTGGNDKAMLWDIRRSQPSLKSEQPMSELEGNDGPVTYLHMDQYKVVTAGANIGDMKIWETDTGTEIYSLPISWLEEGEWSGFPRSAVAVDGCRVATAVRTEREAFIRFWDFSDSCIPVSKVEKESRSRFWDQQSSNDTYSSQE